jgi:hypothetical protein
MIPDPESRGQKRHRISDPGSATLTIRGCRGSVGASSVERGRGGGAEELPEYWHCTVPFRAGGILAGGGVSRLELPEYRTGTGTVPYLSELEVSLQVVEYPGWE